MIVLLLNLQQINFMDQLLSAFRIKINENLFLSDPSSSKLGQKIISHAVILIDELGFEKFTFKKLGEKIESPEASIYRYFRSKNQLLTYLISCYWAWLEYQLVFETANIPSPELRLEKAIALVTRNNFNNSIVDGIEMDKLYKIVISESSKSYLTKDVDKANKEGAYFNYKQFVSRLALLIKEISPRYKYPNMLLSTIIEGAHLQVFFAEHLPGLTNKQKSDNYITRFYSNLAIQSIKSK
jgi:AcrR family transcriptional regulator